MKLYVHTPIKFVRVVIGRQGEKSFYFTLIETTKEAAKKELMKIAQKTGSVFAENNRRTRVDIRDAEGGKNGSSVSFSFYGQSPEEFYNSVMKHLKSKQ